MQIVIEKLNKDGVLYRPENGIESELGESNMGNSTSSDNGHSATKGSKVVEDGDDITMCKIPPEGSTFEAKKDDLEISQKSLPDHLDEVTMYETPPKGSIFESYVSRSAYLNQSTGKNNNQIVVADLLGTSKSSSPIDTEELFSKPLKQKCAEDQGVIQDAMDEPCSQDTCASLHATIDKEKQGKKENEMVKEQVKGKRKRGESKYFRSPNVIKTNTKRQKCGAKTKKRKLKEQIVYIFF